MTMGKMCESCGMPLKASAKGTKRDGSLSSRYCKLCYKDGEFINADYTAEDMRHYGIEGMTERGWPKFLANFMTKNIHKLPRWQQKDTSKPAE